MREEQYCREQSQKSSPHLDVTRASAEEFEGGSALSFSYLVWDLPRYAFRFYQLTKV